MFCALILSNLVYAGTYDLKKFESGFFNARDRALITKYLSDDYLLAQRKRHRARYSQQMFRYLRDSAVQDTKKEMKANPFADLDWPDNREGLEYLMLKIENLK